MILNNLSRQSLKKSIEETTVSSIKIHLQQSKCNNPQQIPFQESYQCKICLTEFLKNRSKAEGAISPCRCTGSMKYVHNACLVQWLNSIVQRNLENGENTYNIGCEICKDLYIYQNKSQWVLNANQQIKGLIKVNWGIFSLAILFILFGISGLITMGVLAGRGDLKIHVNNSPSQISFIIAIIMLFLVLVVWGYRIGHIFLFKKINFIKNIMEKQNNERPIEINVDSTRKIEEQLKNQ